jgi:hypothetical protein
MNRSQLPAFLLPMPLSFALLVGCGQANPGGTWDGAPMMWEVPPPRTIINADGSTDGDPGSLPGMMPRGFEKPCKAVNEPYCCYDGYNITGYPLCRWQALSSGTSVVIDSVFKGDKKITLPSPLVLTSVTPERFTTDGDCTMLPVGFVLEGKGLVEQPMLSSINYWYIDKKGFWRPGTGGQSQDLVIPKNSDPTSRGDAGAEGLPSPKVLLDGDKCATQSEARANVVLFDWVRFTIDDVEYDANFSREPRGEVIAYYARIERTY